MRAVLLAVSALVLAVALGWLLGKRGEPAAPAGPAEVVERSKPLAPVAEEPAEPSAEERVARTEIAPPSPAELRDDQVAYFIRVVHATTGEPVPGAAVHWLPRSLDWGTLSDADKQLISGDVGRLAAKVGETRTTDGQGRVTIHASPKGVTLHGRAGPLCGEVRVRMLDPARRCGQKSGSASSCWSSPRISRWSRAPSIPRASRCAA